MGKKNFSINEDKIKVNFMISKEINQKIKEKRFKEKTTIKNIVEKILQDKVVFKILCQHQISPKILS